MGIGVQSESCGEVTQHSADRLDAHAVLQRDGGEGVTEIMAPNLRDASPLQNPFQHIVHTVRGDRAAVGRGKHIGVVGLSLLLPQDFDCLGRDAHRPVGVLGFQRRFHDFTIHSCRMAAPLIHDQQATPLPLLDRGNLYHWSKYFLTCFTISPWTF